MSHLSGTFHCHTPEGMIPWILTALTRLLFPLPVTSICIMNMDTLHNCEALVITHNRFWAVCAIIYFLHMTLNPCSGYFIFGLSSYFNFLSIFYVLTSAWLLTLIWITLGFGNHCAFPFIYDPGLSLCKWWIMKTLCSKPHAYGS